MKGRWPVIQVKLKGDTMAKKTAKSKAKPKGKAKAKKSAKVVPMKARKTAPKRTQSPRSQVLPGMEQVRNKVLDRVCEGISDVRGDLNRLRGEEKDLQGQAVKAMTAGKVTAYRFAGVELVLVPGDVHLRVRTLKSTANADAPDDAEDAGEGQDVGATLEEMTAEPEDVEGADEEAEMEEAEA